MIKPTNILPDLNRTLKKREAKITPRVLEWFHTQYPHTWFIEIKATEGNTIPPSAVKPHQLQFLKDLRSPKGAKHKISDIGRVRQPLDAFGGKNAQSFVVCAFLTHKVCIAIDPRKWNGATPTTPATFSIDLWSRV